MKQIPAYATKAPRVPEIKPKSVNSNKVDCYIRVFDAPKVLSTAD